jgi:hypothetical protein
MNQEAFISASDQLVGQLMPFALALLSIGFVISVGNYIVNSTISGSYSSGLQNFGGMLLLVACTVAYPSIHEKLRGAAASLVNVLPETASIENALDFSEAYAKKKEQDILKKKKEREQKYADKGTYLSEGWSRLKDKMSDTVDFTLDINWLSILGNWFATGLTLFVRTCIEWLGIILISLVLAFSPVAMGLSSIPGFSGLRQRMLSMIIGIACWPVTMRGLDFIMAKVATHMKGQMLAGNTDAGANFEFVLVEIIICICYIIGPTITSWYTGAASGTFLSKVAGVSAMAGRAAVPAAMNVAGQTAQAGVSVARQGTATAAGMAAGAYKGMGAAILEGMNTKSSSAAMKAGFATMKTQAASTYQQTMGSKASQMAGKAGAGMATGAKKAGDQVKNAVRDWERYVT